LKIDDGLNTLRWISRSMLSITHGNSRTQTMTFASGNSRAIAGIHAHQARLVSKITSAVESA
jgi:hypothetical protein